MLRQQYLSNIEIVKASWEAAEVAPHDVVLAAWSLYRQLDLGATMRKLVETARRTLIIVDGNDDATLLPHYRLMRDIWGPTKQPGLPKHLCFLGALWQIGLHVEVRVVYETRTLTARSSRQLAQRLAPEPALPAALDRFTAGLLPWFSQKTDGWHYSFTHPFEILVWQRVRE